MDIHAARSSFAFSPPGGGFAWGVIAVRRARFGAFGTPTQAAEGGDNEAGDTAKAETIGTL